MEIVEEVEGESIKEMKYTLRVREYFYLNKKIDRFFCTNFEIFSVTFRKCVTKVLCPNLISSPFDEFYDSKKNPCSAKVIS